MHNVKRPIPVSSSLLGSLCHSTRRPNGSAMRNSASGPTGGRSASPRPVTGTAGACMRRVATLTRCILRSTAIRRSSASRMLSTSGRPTSGIPNALWLYTRGWGRSISSPWEIIMTIWTCGTASTNAGTLSTWAPGATSSPSGRKRRAATDCRLV